MRTNERSVGGIDTVSDSVVQCPSSCTGDGEGSVPDGYHELVVEVEAGCGMAFWRVGVVSIQAQEPDV